MPRGGGAVAIVGADVMGKANDEEVRGDAEEVTQRRQRSAAEYLEFRNAMFRCSR